MTERPIPFSGPMVRAILAGTKTQTRRVCKSQPSERFALGGYSRVVEGLTVWGARCPYGAPGDRLWVREAWRTTSAWDRMPPRDLPGRVDIHYEADGRPNTHFCFGKLRPGMFMVRGASRITLEVTEVRVERLQDISEADARAEGYELGAPPCIDNPRRWYRHLWEQINGAGSWDANPWVFVIGFRRLEA